jgi:hypothetical protein
VILVRERKGAVRPGPAAHRKVARGHQHQVVADPVYRRPEPVVGAEDVESGRDGEDLRRRTRREETVAVHREQHLAGGGVPRHHAPRGVIIPLLRDDGVDLLFEFGCVLGVGRYNGLGRGCGGAARSAERSKNDQYHAHDGEQPATRRRCSGSLRIHSRRFEFYGFRRCENDWDVLYGPSGSQRRDHGNEEKTGCNGALFGWKDRRRIRRQQDSNL